MLYFIITFVIIAAVMAIVGFIGNKAADSVENAIRAKRVRQQSTQPGAQERLAARYQKKSETDR